MNQTYYSGQIKPEYRGHFAVFVDDKSSENDFSFSKFPINGHQFEEKTVAAEHSPLRTYLGVNDKAYNALREFYEQTINQEGISEFDLDRVIVEEASVRIRARALNDLLIKNDTDLLNRVLPFLHS